MEVVIDASAILAVLLNEEEKDSIITLTMGLSLLSPGCIEYEIGNAVSALHKRNLISTAEGILIWHEFCKIPIRQVTPNIHDALIIACNESIYAYDAYYLAAAAHYHLPLLTLDDKMRSTAVNIGIQCMEV